MQLNSSFFSGEIMNIPMNDLFEYSLKGLNAISAITSIGGFIYGLFWLQSFKKQKQIENKSADARKALEEVIELEQSLSILFSEADNLKSQVIENLPFQLSKLLYTLYLLKEFPFVREYIQFTKELLMVVSNKEMQANTIATAAVLKDRLNMTQPQNKLVILKEKLLLIYDIQNRK